MLAWTLLNHPFFTLPAWPSQRRQTPSPSALSFDRLASGFSLLSSSSPSSSVPCFAARYNSKLTRKSEAFVSFHLEFIGYSLAMATSCCVCVPPRSFTHRGWKKQRKDLDLQRFKATGKNIFCFPFCDPPSAPTMGVFPVRSWICSSNLKLQILLLCVLFLVDVLFHVMERAGASACASYFANAYDTVAKNVRLC